MEKIAGFKESFVKYLNDTIKVHNDKFLELQRSERKDEAIFERIKVSAIKDMVFPMFILAVDASTAYYNEDEDSKYGKNSDRWNIWNKAVGDAKSAEERIYRLFINNWIDVFKDEARLRKSEAYNDQAAFMKEQSKIDIVNEVAARFKSMFKDELFFEESWEAGK